MKLFLILLVFVYSVNSLSPTREYISESYKPLSDEMVTKINELKLTWKAGENFYEDAIPMSKLVATHEKESFPKFPKRRYSDITLPERFDARKAWPNCPSIGKIYDQKKGFPSWIYPTVGTIADRLCIKAGIKIDVEATVERIMKSNGDFNSEYNSANISQAIHYWSKKGIFTVSKVKDEICLPFAPKGCQPNVIKLNDYFKVIAEQPKFTADSMTDLMFNGPLLGYMNVYADFPSYKSGIYETDSHTSLGMHNIKIIGWGTENGIEYWLAANSWGTHWGDKGYFKIKREGPHSDVSVGIALSLVHTNTVSEIRKDPVDGQLFTLA